MVYDELPALDEVPAELNGKLNLELAGVSSLDEAKLREDLARQIENIQQYGLDEAGAYDAAYYIGQLYRKEGFAGVVVREEIRGPWTLRLNVAEGPRTRVGDLAISGNRAFDTPTLRNYLLGPTRERYPRIKEDLDLPYVKAEIDAGVGLVRRLYAAEGYLEAVVEDLRTILTPDGSRADLRLALVEGRRFTFGEIRWAGELLFPRDELAKAITEETKDAFTEGRVAAAQRKLLDFYKKRGYFTAEITCAADPALAVGGKVPMLVTVTPGGLYRFDGIRVTGNDDVSTDFMEKRFQRLHGRTYDPDQVDRQFRRLIETGLFRNVNITPVAVEGGLVRLDVAVEEAPPKEFGVGAGFATAEGGIFTASYGNKNLWHSGRPFNSEITFSGRGYSGEIEYRDPWLWDTEWRLATRLYAVTRDEEGYTKQDLGFETNLSRRIGRNWRFGAFLRAEHTKLSEVLIEPFALIGPDEYAVYSVGLTQTFDRRNNRALPTSGYYFTNTLEVAPPGLSDVNFIRSTTQFSAYIPVTRRSHLALGARANLTKPLAGGPEELPIDERFFNGGSTSVRSFKEKYLGPKDDKGEYPIGGETALILNVEYTFPIVGDLQGATFFDAGNVMPDIGDFGTDELRYAVGAGLRYNLPIGSMRLDYGYNPNRKPGEDAGAFHFAIGVAF
jgi:outer membrane protein insertion porin family